VAEGHPLPPLNPRRPEERRGGVSPVLGKAGGAHAPAGEKRLPRKDSISRWLIEGWLEDVGCGK